MLGEGEVRELDVLRIRPHNGDRRRRLLQEIGESEEEKDGDGSW